MSVINTNVRALTAQSSLRKINGDLSTAMERLSTGLRVNGAKDDAAGLSISNRMTAQIRGTAMAIRNANDGLSLLQTAEGGINEIGSMLQRMRELAVQAASATGKAEDRAYAQKEVGELRTQISDIVAQTKFNDHTLLDGHIGSASFNLQIGAGSGMTMSITISSMAIGSGNMITSSMTISTVSGAVSAITSIDDAIEAVNNTLAQIGAYQNRLNSTINNLESFQRNTSASRSRIMDTDYATETTNLAKSQIIQQAATAMLAQANQSPQTVLALLK